MQELLQVTLQRLTRQSLDITLRLLLIWKSILIRKRISIHILRAATTLLNVTVLQEIIGELQTFGSTKTQIVFSTSVEHRGIPMSDD